MNVLMFTNTFTPHVGGVVRSISLLRDGLRARGHKVMIVAPRFDGFEEDEPGVLRLPSLRRFRGSTFSVPLPLGRRIAEEVDSFAPDIIHSHHPFLLGDTALRMAAARNVPVVYTYHTRYQEYGHYVALGEERMRRIAQSLSVGFCNLCDAVIAPSASIEADLISSGVHKPIRVIPTGVAPSSFEPHDPKLARQRFGLPQGVFVAGHLGRLVTEKNLPFLAEAMARFLGRNSGAHVLIAGPGPQASAMADIFVAHGLSDRVVFAGSLEGQAQADFYAAIDVFAFSSLSETQGLVVLEAMAAARPVVALDGPGIREVVEDGENGRLLPDSASVDQFAEALEGIVLLSQPDRARLSAGALRAAQAFTVDRMVTQILDLYENTIMAKARVAPAHNVAGCRVARGLIQQGRIIGNIFHALGHAVMPDTGG